jgi:ligand-binding SRPBCC domain-containing protein
VDEQLHGPYRIWEHTHRFRDGGRTTIIEDVVRYRVPFAPFGRDLPSAGAAAARADFPVSAIGGGY